MKIINNQILTKREQEIVLYILEGKNKREIAKSLSLSLSTIKTNVENIYRKFNIHNKAQLIVYVVKQNIIDL